jgi:glyoxylase-like metal-dependent hydrolase (beta-lactamase superfamily II)
MKTLLTLAIGLALVGCTRPVGADPFAYDWHALAPGVWAGIRQDPFELPQEGNVVFVVTDRGVVLFDAGGYPVMGEAIVAKVRSVTPLPITQVVLSHWHGDHMRGLQAILAAFPAAQVLSHPHTREWIATNQDRWLHRRETMVPNIRKNLGAALERDRDLSDRPLIPAEKAWLTAGLRVADRIDFENHRTTFVVPDATFDDRLTLHAGGRDIEFIHLGNAHTAGDVIMWLPRDSVVATGDIVTAPVPLMPSPYTRDYVGVLEQIRALGFKTLVPGHGGVEHDALYLGLLIDTIHSVTVQMKALVASGLSEADATAKVDFSSVEKRFTHGDPFLEHRFQDYVSTSALAHGAYQVENGKDPEEPF